MKQKNNMEFNQKNKCNYVGIDDATEYAESIKNNVGADDSVRPILKRNTQKGITLVALVITIIVLLILAMVSIKIVLDGGLITKAKDATDTHTIAAEKEAIQLGYANYKMQSYDKNKTTSDLEILKEAFVNNENVEEDHSNEGIIIFTNKDKNISIKVFESNLEEKDDKIYANFVYNNHVYRMTISSSIDDIKLIGEELTVDGAKVTRNETSWTIDFGNYNGKERKYQLSFTGNVTNISNAWWKLSDKEKSILNKQTPTTDYAYVQTIATSDDGKWIAYMNASSSRKSADGEFFMIMPDPYKVYLFTISSNSKIGNEKVEQYTWYYTEDSSDFTNAQKYTGESPVSKDDFTMIIDNMSDLVDRMLKSF